MAQLIATLQYEVESLKNKSAPSTEQERATDVTAPARNDTHGAGTDGDNSNSNETRTMLIVQRTINDSVRRKRNILITGLPEQDDGDDRALFVALCEEQLPVKPAVADKDCIRVGKKLQDRPRRLLVKLNSERAATSLLRAAPMLRNSSDQYIASNVYINADLSPTAAQLAYEARKTRREAAARRRVAAHSSTPTSAAAAAADTSNNSSDAIKQSNNTEQTSHATDDASYSQTLNNTPAATDAPPSFRNI